MEAVELIRRAKATGRSALTEAESKAVLKQFGIPVVEEWVAADGDEAVILAERAGFPVVLKGLGARLTHKTERGLVRLNLRGPDEVRRAAADIAQSAGEDLEGFLVQPMLAGKREFVAGLLYDRQFGPVIMFGLGGIYTEALRDIEFRVAPIREGDAAHMMNGLRAAQLLGPFRGEAAADQEQLIRTLVGLSRLGMALEDVIEVDINPLTIGPDGRVTAVDALIILGQRLLQKSPQPPIEPKALAGMFYPRSIAFIGASSEFGKWGHMLFSNVVAGGYRGEIYLVNPKGGQIVGRPVWEDVLDIPGSVDLGIVMIPASKVLELIPKFRAKGIKNMLLVSSGFAETGDTGRKLEQQLVEAARAAGVLILGPNTMGICNPHNAFYCTGMHIRPMPGCTTLVAQSGNLGTQLLAFAASEGIGIRAFGGSGNEAMITIEDYMDGFEVDDLTRTVVLYLESIKDGRRFLESARRVGHRKPIIILKGGRTEAGHRAAASHTGAMASDDNLFKAACEQVGIILADQPMDLLDLSAAFSAVPLPKGNRVAILTLGGGWGVVATDLCIEHGLAVPHLPEMLITRINHLLPPYWSRTNPIDLVAEFDPELPKVILEELLKWDGCDAVIHLGMVGRINFIMRMIDSAIAIGYNLDPPFRQQSCQQLSEIEVDFVRHSVKLMERYQKPILGVSLMVDENMRTITEVEGIPHKGVCFVSPERAVKALAKMFAYQSWLDREGVRETM